MRQYLLSVHSVDGDPTPGDEEMQIVYRETAKINDAMMATGTWVFAGGLLGADSSTVVRNAGGQVTMTDGPFAETREHLAGFWVIKVDDLDQALEWAARCAAACGPIEVRPFDELSRD